MTHRIVETEALPIGRPVSFGLNKGKKHKWCEPPMTMLWQAFEGACLASCPPAGATRQAHASAKSTGKHHRRTGAKDAIR